jgi:hypothetical protein
MAASDSYTALTQYRIAAPRNRPDARTASVMCCQHPSRRQRRRRRVLNNGRTGKPAFVEAGREVASEHGDELIIIGVVDDNDDDRRIPDPGHPERRPRWTAQACNHRRRADIEAKSV